MKEHLPSDMVVRTTLLLVGIVLMAIPTLAGINTWTTNGPYGASVTSLAVDPQRPTTVYAGGHGRVYRSTDAGAHWEDLNRDRWDDEGGAHLLAVDPKDSQVLYTGGFGLFKSTDGGCTWVPTDGGIPDADPFFTCIAVDPITPATLYVGTNGRGLFKSINGGASWTDISEGLPGKAIEAVALDPSDPWTMYIGIYGNGLYKSTNAGASWVVCEDGFPGLSGAIAIAIDPVTPSTLYASTYSETVDNGVFKSADGGASWTSANAGLPTAYYGHVHISDLVIDPLHPNVLYAGTDNNGLGLLGTRIYKSTDGGSSWAAVNDGLVDSYISALAMDPAHPEAVYAGDYRRGLFKTTDGGGTWGVSVQGMGGAGVTCLVPHPSEPGTVFVGGVSDLFKTTDGGQTWSPTGGGFPPSYDWIRSLAIDPRTPDTMYAVADSGSYARADVFKSTDGGVTWAAIHQGIPATAGVELVALDPLTPSTLYLGTWYGGVFKSTDAGGTWFAINDGLPGLHWDITVLAVDPLTPSTLYAGTDYVWLAPGLFKSIDGGAHWFQVFMDPGFNTVGYLVIDPHTPSTLYIQAGGERYKSTDGGETWAAILEGGWIPEAFDPQNPETVYGLGKGVQKSADGGASWAAINNGLPTGNYGFPFASLVAMDPLTPSTLYAGSGKVYSITMVEGVPGDCDGDGQVSIGEVQRSVNLFLGSLPPQCGMDCDGDGVASIGEVQRVINGFLGLPNACYYTGAGGSGTGAVKCDP